MTDFVVMVARALTVLVIGTVAYSICLATNKPIARLVKVAMVVLAASVVLQWFVPMADKIAQDASQVKQSVDNTKKAVDRLQEILHMGEDPLNQAPNF